MLAAVFGGLSVERVEVTAYCHSGVMYSGQETFVGATACGWQYPVGTEVYIMGYGAFPCLDRGRLVEGVDIYTPDCAEAWRIGRSLQWAVFDGY